jgi:hypothetical protein
MRNLILGVVMAAFASTTLAEEPCYPSKYGRDGTTGDCDSLVGQRDLDSPKQSD